MLEILHPCTSSISDMASFNTLPLELKALIMGYLDTNDKLACAEASSELAELCDVQVETDTNFEIRPIVKTLTLVLSEPKSRSSVEAALVRYRAVDLILARSIVEDDDEDQLERVLRWIETVTGKGPKFRAIEAYGRMATCGGRFGEMTKYCDRFVIEQSQCEGVLRCFFEEAGKTTTTREIVYDGVSDAVPLYRHLKECVPRNIVVRVREEQIVMSRDQFSGSSGKKLIKKIEKRLKWYTSMEAGKYIVDVGIGIRVNVHDPVVGRRRGGCVECALEIVKAFCVMVR